MKNTFLHTSKRFIFVAITILLVASCQEPQSTENEGTVSVQDLKGTYGNTLSQPIALSPTAQVAVMQWSVFDDFQENLNSLSGKTVPALQARTEQMQSQADSLLKKIPDTLNTRPILERMILMNTRVKLLQQQVNNPRVDSLKIEMALAETHRAANDLFAQINGKLNKNRIDEQLRETEKKELEKQQRFLDSVYQQELKDNNNQKL